MCNILKDRKMYKMLMIVHDKQNYGDLWFYYY